MNRISNLPKEGTTLTITITSPDAISVLVATFVGWVAGNFGIALALTLLCWLVPNEEGFGIAIKMIPFIVYTQLVKAAGALLVAFACCAVAQEHSSAATAAVCFAMGMFAYLLAGVFHPASTY